LSLFVVPDLQLGRRRSGRLSGSGLGAARYEPARGCQCREQYEQTQLGFWTFHLILDEQSARQ
jgi:hypothetical protein